MPVRAAFLVGFMGSGKNAVGRELARRLRWDFVDLDAQIEAREQQTISEIFRLRGEPAFRLAETNALRDLLASSMCADGTEKSLQRDCVVALGGGAFVQEANRELLRNWPTVFLDAPPDELWQRCEQDGVERPLRKNRTQFARLYAERLPYYRQASLVVETTGKQLASICEEIEHALKLGASQDNATAANSSHAPIANRATNKSSFNES